MARLILSLFGRFAWPFLVPAKTASATARSRGRGRPSGRRAGRASLDGGEYGRKLSINGTPARRSRAKCASVLVFGLLCMAPDWTGERAIAAAAVRRLGDFEAAVDEAAGRFDVPRTRLLAVIAAESGGDPRAISAKGAMGLMQLMPATWREIRDQLALGSDPFDVRDNILAGAFYLRRLQDRFGADGGLAAYNAGPQRYADHLATGRALPVETVDYVARILRRLTISSDRPAQPIRDWRSAPLFVAPPAAEVARGDGR